LSKKACSLTRTKRSNNLEQKDRLDTGLKFWRVCVFWRPARVDNSTEVYVRQKMQRSFWSYGAVDKSQSTDGQSQRKFENERCTATSRQKKQRIIIYREISTLAPFFSIARLQLAFPHIETVKCI